MKKNKMMRIASVLLVAVLLSTSVISGTFAKYTSTATGSDTAKVAKWDIQFNGDQMGYTDTFTFDLFKNTVTDTLNGADEADVKVGNETTAIIAPGTKGEFVIDLTNNSEVNAQYKIDYVVTNDNDIPVQFRVKLDSGEFSAWADDLTDISTFVNFPMNANAKYTIEWQWEFERGADDNEKAENNEFDTTLGFDGTATITVAATVTVEQVD